MIECFFSAACSATERNRKTSSLDTCMPLKISVQDITAWDGYLIDLDDMLALKAVYKCNMRP